MDRRDFLFLSIAPVGLSRQDPRLDRNSRLANQLMLRRLPRVGVMFSVLGDAAGLIDIGRLQTRVELRLRQLGVPVVSGNVAPAPTLVLVVYSIQPSVGLYALSTSISLVEPLEVPRLGGAAKLGTSWGGNPLLSAASGSTLLADVEQSVSDLVELFANDYLAANP